ncbi:MAG: hypothetical protein WCP17_01175 [bacterium]
MPGKYKKIKNDNKSELLLKEAPSFFQVAIQNGDTDMESTRYYFLPTPSVEVAASERLPKELLASSEKDAVAEAIQYGNGVLCEVILRLSRKSWSNTEL